MTRFTDQTFNKQTFWSEGRMLEYNEVYYIYLNYINIKKNSCILFYVIFFSYFLNKY